jgi:hypothetical protein
MYNDIVFILDMAALSVLIIIVLSIPYKYFRICTYNFYHTNGIKHE